MSALLPGGGVVRWWHLWVNLVETKLCEFEWSLVWWKGEPERSARRPEFEARLRELHADREELKRG